MTTQIQAAEELGATQWRDRKRYLWLMGLIPPTALFVMLPIVWGLNQFGWHGAAQVPMWIGPILLYILLPILDLRFGPDGQNPPDEVMEQLENDKYYRYCTYIYIPFQYLSVVLGAYLFTASDLHWLGFETGPHGGLGWVGKIGVALSVGVLGGVGINTAHEMGHKKDSLERWLSKITLAQTAYGHFYIEHNRGHHVRVSTPEDPASARFGETFWEFLPRSVFGSLRSSVQLEAQRIRRLGRSPWDPRTYASNDVLNAWAMSVVLFGALIAFFGVGVIPFIVIQAVFGFSLLETVNYLEHYGLLRQRTANGRYERCAPVHSWNSDHIVTNLFLYHLQRHSDHHANPTRRYQTLRSMEGAPNLPSGYASMIALTYFPPVWRKVMDHRVLAHYDGDITKVNVHPRMRDKVLAKYGVPA
ncbi:MAG: alkane 1-monooxygenase [Actinomycetota bacterium]|uniref:Alkane 1-monooxygenase n=1 Tax=Mycobacterium lentiflavum TaxID=141349 RepID=A0ABY3V1R7_MYCLN|nr:alkane 1-monooxygenase [Mycobacterium lentiflavum]MEE3067214.1 alkane 1-monooxygenase [Actinomycetota bacterium]ULP43573.1 alkane 1-monooxygenase [Mycobacterium lentiflavum]